MLGSILSSLDFSSLLRQIPGSRSDGSADWVSATHERPGLSSKLLASALAGSNPAPAIVGIWDVNQQVKPVSLTKRRRGEQEDHKLEIR